MMFAVASVGPSDAAAARPQRFTALRSVVAFLQAAFQSVTFDAALLVVFAQPVSGLELLWHCLPCAPARVARGRRAWARRRPRASTSSSRCPTRRPGKPVADPFFLGSEIVCRRRPLDARRGSPHDRQRARHVPHAGSTTRASRSASPGCCTARADAPARAGPGVPCVADGGGDTGAEQRPPHCAFQAGS